MGSLTECKLVLGLADKSDFGLIGINAKSVPDNLPAGRCHRTPGGAQAQIALLVADASGAAQAEALAEIAATALERDKGIVESAKPFGVDVLPSRISFQAAWQLRPAETPALWAMVGVGGDRLTAIGPDLDAGTPVFLIGGPPRSGRSTALHSMAGSCLLAGTRVLVVAPRPTPLTRLAGEPGVVAVGEDLTSEALLEAIKVGGPLVVLVDDAELMRAIGAAAELAEVVRRGYPSVAMVLAGDPEGIGSGFSGWQVDARRARRGLLLSPQNITDADLIGARVPRGLIANPIEPGRGLLHLGDGHLLTVQVPQP